MRTYGSGAKEQRLSCSPCVDTLSVVAAGSGWTRSKATRATPSWKSLRIASPSSLGVMASTFFAFFGGLAAFFSRSFLSAASAVPSSPCSWASMRKDARFTTASFGG